MMEIVGFVVEFMFGFIGVVTLLMILRETRRGGPHEDDKTYVLGVAVLFLFIFTWMTR